ncbi:hypothetical protein [Xenophilus sp. Marseille-Q4582]|uniref:hypothetical protein n=1 Tax=Xenophilus sp. Marseille-Q4582 TaxID=2866600 RepID=UPI001CE3D2E9|nr:hypothetical protein [Xenophilus sp. Marseille-Q4582]
MAAEMNASQEGHVKNRTNRTRDRLRRAKRITIFVILGAWSVDFCFRLNSDLSLFLSLLIIGLTGVALSLWVWLRVGPHH